jgi:hypothetical protein
LVAGSNPARPTRCKEHRFGGVFSFSAPYSAPDSLKRPKNTDIDRLMDKVDRLDIKKLDPDMNCELLIRRLRVRVPPGVPKKTHLEPAADNSQPKSAEEFLAELRFEKRHLLAELPVELERA